MSTAVQIHIQIHERALEISTRYQRAESELIDALEQVESHHVYLHMGRSSLFQYGVHDLKLSENVVYNLITIMRKSREIPELKSEIQQGNINLSNARRIVPILTLENKKEWIEKASKLSQCALEKEIVKIKPLIATPERAKYINQSRIKLELGLEETAMLKLRRVQDLLSQSLSKSASLEDTLIAMTEFYLQHKDPVMKAKRVIAKKGFVHSKKPTNELVSIPVQNHLIATKTQNLTHHSMINRPINSRTTVPAAILHQVNLRDQRKCTYLNSEGGPCSQTRYTEIHHIKPVAQGGENTLQNLTTLCSTHHQWIHSKIELPLKFS